MSSGSFSAERTPERRQLRVLEALDQAKTQYYHLSAVLIAGMGFYTDAYDLFCIGIVTKLLGRIYYQNDVVLITTTGLPSEPGVLPIGVNAAVSLSALVGTFVGQIVFGWLGDKLGRKKAYGITLGIMFFFSLASGLSIGNSPKAVMSSLCFFRFWLGFGVGGDYPLSATIMAEYANTKTRGAFIAAVFAMQGFGILTGGVVGLTLAHFFDKAYPTASFASSLKSCSPSPSCHLSTAPQADFLWRIMFMLGAIPAAATFYYRMRMPETARYTALVKGNAKKAASDMTKVLNIPVLELSETAINVRGGVGSEGSGALEFSLMSREFLNKHGLQLLGTATTWFLLDISFYSQNLFMSRIFQEIHWTPDPKTMNGLHEVYVTARAQSILACCSTVPGYFLTVLLVDRIGRKIIQLQGFIFMATFLFAIAIQYNTLVNGEKGNVAIFLVLYFLVFFFSNFGPNTTTFIVPAELFPARLRATCHGISAASGKLGAIVGSFGFLFASEPRNRDQASPYPPGIGPKNTFLIMAAANIVGAAFTLLIQETKSKSLEEISGENDIDFEPHDKSVRGAISKPRNQHRHTGPLPLFHPKRSSTNSAVSIGTPGYLHPKRSSTSSAVNIGTPDYLHPKKSSTSSIGSS